MKINRNIISDYEKMFVAMGGYHPISEELREAVYANSTWLCFSKGELLQVENEHCNTLFFIVEGFCSCYYNKDGKEWCLRFSGDGSFCTSWYSLLGDRRSNVNIKATEETAVIGLSREVFNGLRGEYPDFAAVIQKVMEEYVVQNESRFFMMRSNDAEGRVRHCMATSEIYYLLKHVPRYSIASYLDMTQETFSKIFTRLNKMGDSE